MKLAYLASELTLPESPKRKPYAIEHDQMMSVLRPVFECNGGEVHDIAWDAKHVDWQMFDAVMIGSTWDYFEHQETFVEVLHQINDQTPVYNPPALAQWNSHKGYLRDLEMKGANLIPTLWSDTPETINWEQIFDTFETDQIVVKRQIGANAEGQFRLKRGETPPLISYPVMIQPFLKTVVDEGEYSFVFVDNDLSHALIKRPAANDYRIQATYGGTEATVTPSLSDLKAAKSVLQMIDQVPLYARVDMLRNSNGDLCLMELELIEPFLYPLQGPELADRLYSALEKRLGVNERA